QGDVFDRLFLGQSDGPPGRDGWVGFISKKDCPTIYLALQWISLPVSRFSNLNIEFTPSIERVPADSANNARRYISLSRALDAPLRKTASMSAIPEVRVYVKEIQIPSMTSSFQNAAA
ncbi:MAG: hypothetical protein Q9226_008955, partial [Calogaya cf. arnoldii]